MHPAKKAPALDWNRICVLHPYLRGLYEQAKGVRDDKRKKRFCANQVFDAQFKPYFENHVGWNSPTPELKSSLAYDIVCHKIYNALPDCRNCFCAGMGNSIFG
jgi:hypothetical protein